MIRKAILFGVIGVGMLWGKITLCATFVLECEVME